MSLQIKVKVADLLSAIDIVSTVPPRQVPLPGGVTNVAGYLIMVEGGKASIYSRDNTHVSRASLAIEEASADGAFVFPADLSVRSLAKEDVLTFTSQEEEGGKFSLSYVAASSAKLNATVPTLDPRLMARFDDDIKAATGEWVFPVAILRDAIGLAKPFISQVESADDVLKTIQVFDDTNEAWAKGNGTLFAANGVAAFYFQCDAFKGKGLGIHSQHFGIVLTFLAKCSGNVTIKTGKNMTFAIDERGSVIGWAHQTRRHMKYGYYSLAQDKMVLDVPVDVVLRALTHMRDNINVSQDNKIRVIIDAIGKEMRFTATQGSRVINGPPVIFNPHAETVLEDKSFGVNIEHFTSLMSGAKGDRLELRLSFLPPNDKRPREQAMIRTLDEFVLDRDGKVIGGSGVQNPPEGSFRCLVTRYVSSKD